MKRKIQYAVLLIEAVLCICIVLVPSVNANSLAIIMAFPLAPFGDLLRKLSLSGTAGNVFAVAIYLIVCLAPCLLFIRKSKKYYLEDSVIILLSGALFFVVYLMTNPSYIAFAGGLNVVMPIAKAILGGIIYSIIIGYFVLRALRLFRNSEAAGLQNHLDKLLFLLNMVFVSAIFVGLFANSINEVKQMTESNSANRHLYAINIVFIALKFIVQSLPYAFNIAIIFAAINLLQSKTLQAATKLSALCSGSLIVIVLSNVLINIAQILFSQSLFSVNAVVQIPLVSIIFVLVCLLFAQLVKENAALKAENDSFI